jgi:3-oxoadipate enol-lactonase
MLPEFNPPRYIMIGERKLAYEEIAPPNPQGTVLLITGLASKRQGWYRQIPAFSARYRTIILDNRDIGDSDLTPAGYRTPDQADDAAALLSALGVDRAYVAGISMGGFIALELTLRHPDLVAKLVLTSTSAGGRSHTQPNWRVRFSFVVPRTLPFLLRSSFARGDRGRMEQQVYARLTAPGYLASHPDDAEAIARIARYRPQPLDAYTASSTPASITTRPLASVRLQCPRSSYMARPIRSSPLPTASISPPTYLALGSSCIRILATS